MTTRFGICIATILLGLGLALGWSGGAVAQTPLQAAAQEEVASGSVSPDQLQELVKTLEDPAAREQLVGQIKALLEARRKAEQGEEPRERTVVSDLFETIAGQAAAINRRLSGVALLIAGLPEAAEDMRSAALDSEQRMVWLNRLVVLAVVFGAALLAEAAAHVIVRRPAAAIAARSPASHLVRVPLAIARLAVRIVPIAVFVTVVNGGLSWMGAASTLWGVAIAVAHGYAALRLVLLVGDTLLEPDLPSIRMLPVEDENAHYAYLWLRRLTIVVIVGTFGVEALRAVGFPADARVVLANAIGLTVAAMLAVLILQNRRDVSDALRRFASAEGRSPAIGMLVARLADVWHVLTIFYVVAIYLVWALNVDGGFEYVLRATLLTLVMVVAARLVAHFATRLIDRGFSLSDDVKQRFPGMERRANRYLPILRSIVQTLIVSFAALAVLRVWGIESFAWLGTDRGLALVSATISIAIVLVIALLLWEGVGAALERYIEKLERTEGMARISRARTLVPMVRKAILGVLVTIVALIVLSELGINIGPLLAGAGIIGIAVGFGAQKLVQDVITGGFLLIEDTVSVGDVVQAGSNSGLVEQINIRTLVLRDLAGNVHTIPYSTVDRITNMTKDFSRYVFNVGVAYREDLDEVIRVLTELGAELREDEEFGPLIRKDLEIMGVDEFADSAIIIKARFETEPIKQWKVGREFNRRMKRRFDELGIEIPFPHQTIYFGVDKAGAAPPARIVLDGQATEQPTPDTEEAPAALPDATPRDDNVGEENQT